METTWGEGREYTPDMTPVHHITHTLCADQEQIDLLYTFNSHFCWRQTSWTTIILNGCEICQKKALMRQLSIYIKKEWKTVRVVKNISVCVSCIMQYSQATKQPSFPCMYPFYVKKYTQPLTIQPLCWPSFIWKHLHCPFRHSNKDSLYWNWMKISHCDEANCRCC